MYNKILIPVDGSERSIKAAKHAGSLAEKLGSEVTLLHVMAPLPTSVNRYIERDCNDPEQPADNVKKTLMDELVEEGEQFITKLKWDIAKNDLTVITKVIVGDPSDVICRLSADYELVIMGSRGLGELKGFFMGSVSNRVVRHAKCPVLIYR